MSLLEKLKKNTTIKETATLSESKLFNKKDMIQTPVPILNVALSGSLTSDQKEQRVQSNRKNAKLGGEKSKELGTNFSTWDTEKQKKVCSLGGKSHLGKIWIYKGDIKTRVKQEDLQQYLMNGWLKGRGK
jgi:hypothetical protein